MPEHCGGRAGEEHFCRIGQTGCQAYVDWKCKLIFLGVSSLYTTTGTFISEFCVSGYLAVYYLVRFCATFYFIFQISISFAHTIGTRVRLSLLRSVSRRQKDKDPKAVCSVSSFTSRPMLRVGGGKDQGTRFLTFVDAMLGFRHLLTQEDLDKAASMCQGLKGHLKSRFLVLSDDRQPPPPPNRKRRFDDEDQADQQGKRFQNVSSRAAGQPQTVTRQFKVSQPHASQESVAPPQVTQAQVLANQGYFNQLVQTLTNPGIFSPTSFPPLPSTQAPIQTKPLLQQPRLVVQGDGYQTVSNRHSRRLSQKVAGVDRIDASVKPRSQPQGLTEELEQIDQDVQDGGSMSDTSFVDAPEASEI